MRCKNMIAIKKEDIHRLQVCAWAYGWADEEVQLKINEFIFSKQLEDYWKQQEEQKNLIEGLIEEAKIKQIDFKQEYLGDFKNRGYGNKYIKRKNRNWQ